MTSTTRKLNSEVAIIGGGPAGAAMAILLQQQGHDCVIVEHSEFPRYHIGESLIPHTFGVLTRLGLIDQMKESHFPVKHSVRFVSKTGDKSDSFYFSDTIEGDGAKTWQVERSEFDQMCLNRARELGVQVIQPASVKRVLFDGDQATGLHVQCVKGDVTEIHSRVVVDASGRINMIGKQLDLCEPVAGLDKSSIWTYYRGARRRPGIDAGETTIFMIPERGWFWFIPLPDDITSVGLVASPSYLFTDSQEFESAFDRELARCTPLMEFLDGAEQTSPIRGLRRLAYRNRNLTGDGWVMVGDAAAFLDPIYSSGLYLALASAEMASGCVHEALVTGDLSAEKLGQFVPDLTAGVEVIRRLIFAFYDDEFSFGAFVKRYPEHRNALIDCLVGDVVGKDMGSFLAALDQMAPPAANLSV